MNEIKGLSEQFELKEEKINLEIKELTVDLEKMNKEI